MQGVRGFTKTPGSFRALAKFGLAAAHRTTPVFVRRWHTRLADLMTELKRLIHNDQQLATNALVKAAIIHAH